MGILLLYNIFFSFIQNNIKAIVDSSKNKAEKQKKGKNT